MQGSCPLVSALPQGTGCCTALNPIRYNTCAQAKFSSNGTAFFKHGLQEAQRERQQSSEEATRLNSELEEAAGVAEALSGEVERLQASLHDASSSADAKVAARACAATHSRLAKFGCSL